MAHISQAPENTEQKHCDLASCAPKQWQLSVQTKEMEASGLNSSILSPFCDALPEFDCQGPEFPPVEELMCNPYSPAYTAAVFQALDLNGPEYSTVDADIMKDLRNLPVSILPHWICFDFDTNSLRMSLEL